jgi:hypothetical protein
MGARNFQIAPPESATVEFFDWGQDTNGNPTAKILAMWSNGLTGAAHDGGHFASKRRIDYGYRNNASEAGLPWLAEFFPGTCWKLDGETRGSRHEGRESFTACRDYDAESVPVLFRAVKSGDHKGTIDAFFPTLAGTNEPWTCTVYSRVGQHCSGSKDYYRDTRAATPAEYAPLKRELESLGYKLEVKSRWTSWHDDKRAALLAVSRETPKPESV